MTLSAHAWGALRFSLGVDADAWRLRNGAMHRELTVAFGYRRVTLYAVGRPQTSA